MSYNNASAVVNASSIPLLDLHNQTITFVDSQGFPVEVSMRLVEDNYVYVSRLAILYSSQLGACFAMAMVLLVMNPRKSYRQPVFVLNLASLLLGVLRGLFQALYCVGPWIGFYPMFSGDYAGLPASAFRLSITALVFPFLMLITINSSLVLQAHTVSKMMDKKFAYPLFAASVVVVLLAIAFRFAFTILNAQSILGQEQLTAGNARILKIGSSGTATMAIWWFSIIFFLKLVYTIVTRRRNGWKRYSTLRVLAIMSGCTMAIPSFFAIIEYTNVAYSFPETGSLTLTITALLLPLSSMWAKMTDQEEEASIRESIRAAGVVNSQRNSGPNTRYGSESSTVMGSDERKGSIVPLKNTATIDTVIGSATSTRDSTELDLEAMGVRVDRSYSINSC